MAGREEEASGRTSSLVTLAYSDLQEGIVSSSSSSSGGQGHDSVLEALQRGFGPSGLGIISISGVPQYEEARQDLLRLGLKLANLPAEAKAQLEDPESSFNFGWSHGREQLQRGQPDYSKGSFYANPLLDCPTTDAALMASFPSYCRPNKWPHHLLPEFESAFKRLGRIIAEVGFLVAHHCDRLVQRSNPAADSGRLQRVLTSSRCHKARLLHYFPRDTPSPPGPPPPPRPPHSSLSAADSLWCNWHTDHGSLTGLTRALFSNALGIEQSSSDSWAGLWVQAADGSMVKVSIPEGHVAFQMGEAMQIHSGGVLRATPHCVKAPTNSSAASLSRDTFAVFLQPHWDELLDPPKGALPSVEIGVGQWEPGMSFGTFSEKTFSEYY